MYKKEFLYVLVLVILFVCPVISADDSENGGVSKKDEQPIEKKRFLSWLLDDFKITKAGAELSVSKEKADYYNLIFEGKPVLESQKIKMSSDKKGCLFVFYRTKRETSETPERRMMLYAYYIRSKRAVEDSDNITIPKDLLNEFPHPLKVAEWYIQSYRLEEKNLKSSVQMKIGEKLYIFPVEKAEMENFMSLVPKDQFTAEVYDGFVVLRCIYSQAEAEKRKDFLLNTNGQSKGLWDMVDKYEGRRIIRYPRAHIL